MDKVIKIHIRLRKQPVSIWNADNPFLSYTCNGKTSSFDCFESVFVNENNKEVYDMCVKDSIKQFKNGECVTIFAYGQTGSGKTHTLLGGTEDGLIKIALSDIFPECVELGFIEIFNEKIYDLYTGNEARLFSQENKCVLQGVRNEKLKSEDEALFFIDKCLENRKTSQTKFNDFSSRSHAILQIKRGDAIITFIDLAGSERSCDNGNRMKEAAFINKSLLSLGKLVNNMLNNRGFGFRESKLTRILQEPISKRTKMIAFCMINPVKECLSESLGTLSFAGRLSNLDVHLAKVENEKLNGSDFICKDSKIDFFKFNINKEQLEVIQKQKTRIEELEAQVVDLLKQVRDKQQEETYLLEKQIYNLKINDKEYFYSSDSGTASENTEAVSNKEEKFK